jgi:hypothetical protein
MGGKMTQWVNGAVQHVTNCHLRARGKKIDDFKTAHLKLKS